jgi:hypothetical protein
MDRSDVAVATAPQYGLPHVLRLYGLPTVEQLCAAPLEETRTAQHADGNHEARVNEACNLVVQLMRGAVHEQITASDIDVSARCQAAGLDPLPGEFNAAAIQRNGAAEELHQYTASLLKQVSEKSTQESSEKSTQESSKGGTRGAVLELDPVFVAIRRWQTVYAYQTCAFVVRRVFVPTSVRWNIVSYNPAETWAQWEEIKRNIRLHLAGPAARELHDLFEKKLYT